MPVTFEEDEEGDDEVDDAETLLKDLEGRRVSFLPGRLAVCTVEVDHGCLGFVSKH
jgi:hypothetical protein